MIHARRSAELEPLTLIFPTNTGQICRWMGRPDEAREELRNALEVDPHFLLARLALGQVHADAGRLDEAIEEFERAVRDSGCHPYAAGHLGYA